MLVGVGAHGGGSWAAQGLHWRMCGYGRLCSRSIGFSLHVVVELTVRYLVHNVYVLHVQLQTVHGYLCVIAFAWGSTCDQALDEGTVATLCMWRSAPLQLAAIPRTGVDWLTVLQQHSETRARQAFSQHTSVGSVWQEAPLWQCCCL